MSCLFFIFYGFIIIFQVPTTPPTVEILLKSRICEKKQLPYEGNEDVTFYDPGCVEGVYVCGDICGKKCKKSCKSPPDGCHCARGHLPDDFLHCPSRSNDVTLEYITYGLVLDKHTKEGKKLYKRMDQQREDMTLEKFLQKFRKDFAVHRVEHWYLNTLKNYSSNKEIQQRESLISTSDFAQNLKLSKKHETSEEYFHKVEIAVFGSVSSCKTDSQHSFSQITTSNCK